MNIINYVAAHASIIDYYDNQIGVLNQKYKEKSWQTVKVVVCPLHNDHDASLGLMRDRNNKGVLRYHCFGCGATGTVVNLHQHITKQKTGKTLSLLEAARELATLYNIEVDEDSLDSVDTSISSYYAERTTSTEDILANSMRPSIRNYQRNFQKLRRAKDAGIDNGALIQNYDKLNSAYKEALLVIRD